jgi:hypothetical protein
MENESFEQTESTPRTELVAIFAAAIRRLLDRDALNSTNSAELSATVLDVVPRTGLNCRHG